MTAGTLDARVVLRDLLRDVRHLDAQAVVELDLAEQLRPTDYLWFTTRGRRKLRRDPIGHTTFERWYRRTEFIGAQLLEHIRARAAA